MLVELTARFKKQFGEAKREKNILDFTDMEHFALDILMHKEGDTITPSAAAWELSAPHKAWLQPPVPYFSLIKSVSLYHLHSEDKTNR